MNLAHVGVLFLAAAIRSLGVGLIRITRAHGTATRGSAVISDGL